MKKLKSWTEAAVIFFGSVVAWASAIGIIGLILFKALQHDIKRESENIQNTIERHRGYSDK